MKQTKQKTKIVEAVPNGRTREVKRTPTKRSGKPVANTDK